MRESVIAVTLNTWILLANHLNPWKQCDCGRDSHGPKPSGAGQEKGSLHCFVSQQPLLDSRYQTSQVILHSRDGSCSVGVALAVASRYDKAHRAAGSELLKTSSAGKGFLTDRGKANESHRVPTGFSRTRFSLSARPNNRGRGFNDCQPVVNSSHSIQPCQQGSDNRLRADYNACSCRGASIARHAKRDGHRPSISTGWQSLPRVPQAALFVLKARVFSDRHCSALTFFYVYTWSLFCRHSGVMLFLKNERQVVVVTLRYP